MAARERRCDARLATPVEGAEASRLWVRFREHRDSLFVFLDDTAVPPTNNASEQALRPSVVHRNVSGGFRSEWDADAHALVTTVLLLLFTPGAPRERYFEGLPHLGEMSEEERQAFYVHHDTFWL